MRVWLARARDTWTDDDVVVVVVVVFVMAVVEDAKMNVTLLVW